MTVTRVPCLVKIWGGEVASFSYFLHFYIFIFFPFYECSIAQNSRFTHDDAFLAVVSTQDNIFGEGGWLHDCQSFCTSIG